MIVLSVGMPRAGSGWHYNLTHDLMRASGCAEAVEIRARFGLQDVLTEVNSNIGVLSARRLARVAIPALQGNTFVIKAHSRPTLAFRMMRGVGLLRATYIYRDPRDAMLSAMEYGRRGESQGRQNAFSDVVDFDRAVEFMAIYVRIWKAWMGERGILVSRYEDLLQDYDAQAVRLIGFLGLDGGDPAIRAVIERYRPERAGARQGTHFSRGRIGRFRDAFSADEQRSLAERFGSQLREMGYTI
jgi:hypothetical protein